MPIVVMLVSARSDGRSDASSLDLSSGPIKKRTIKQKAFGFRVRLRIPPAGRPRCCSVAIDTHDDVKTLVARCQCPSRAARGRGGSGQGPEPYHAIFDFPRADPTASDRSGHEHVSSGQEYSTSDVAKPVEEEFRCGLERTCSSRTR